MKSKIAIIALSLVAFSQLTFSNDPKIDRLLKIAKQKEKAQKQSKNDTIINEDSYVDSDESNVNITKDSNENKKNKNNEKVQKKLMLKQKKFKKKI